MSSATWTPAALSRERRRLALTCWRLVESQFHASTMKLVSTLEEQARLEELIDAVKPPVPPECRDLHYLFSTPFRYGAPYPQGSRFRRAGFTPGVYYASEQVGTAVAELAFHRLLFYADSPSTRWPSGAGGYTAFSARVSGDGLDLTLRPFDDERDRWTHPTEYGDCQALADAARDAGVELLRYWSARDAGGINVAALTCGAFASAAPLERQAWHVHFGTRGVRAVCDFPEQRLEFDREAFGNDPRIASLARIR